MRAIFSSSVLVSRSHPTKSRVLLTRGWNYRPTTLQIFRRAANQNCLSLSLPDYFLLDLHPRLDLCCKKITARSAAAHEIPRVLVDQDRELGESSMGTTEAIVDFATQTTSEDIPTEVFKHAKRHVIDTLGLAIGATLEPLAENLAAVIAGQRQGETVLWNGRGRTTALEAAWVNGTLAHALDFDDGGVELTPMHP